jgi:hypothetical protein
MMGDEYATAAHYTCMPAQLAMAMFVTQRAGLARE